MNNLAAIRKKRKLTQTDVAKALNIGQSTLSQYERGTRALDEALISMFADYFQVSTDYLLGRDGTAASTNKEPDQEAIELARQIKNLPPEQRGVIEQQIKIWHSLDKKD